MTAENADAILRRAHRTIDAVPEEERPVLSEFLHVLYMYREVLRIEERNRRATSDGGASSPLGAEQVSPPDAELAGQPLPIAAGRAAPEPPAS